MRPTRSEQDAPRPTQEEHARVKRELEEAERERQRLQRRIERLEKQNTRLRRQLDAARRAGYRQTAPFAKALTCRPKRPGRRAGAQYGQPARRRRPTRVDVRHDAPLPPSCPACGGRVRSTGVASQLQEELPVPRVVVREFRVAIGDMEAGATRERVLNEPVRPSGNIPRQIRELTGITNEMVADADTIDRVLPRVAAFVGDAPIVRHNAHFDRRFLEHNARLMGATFAANEWVCTMRMAQRAPLGGPYKLGALAERLDIPDKGNRRSWHSAQL